MVLRLLVLGCGELGTACALSLLASGVSARVTIAGRDVEYLRELRRGSCAFHPFGRRISVPPELSVRLLGERSIETDGPADALFLCVPVASLTWSEASTVLECVRQHVDVPMFVFTRGFTRDGLTPAEQLSRVLQQRLPKLVVVSGPVSAREWATANANGRERGESNSGVSLCLSLSDVANAGARGATHSLVEQLWRRESVTWISDPLSAELLSLINGCAPLCSMGAGLVSNEYPASVSAAMSYLQHAADATGQLVNEMLGQARGTGLPACAVSTIAMACTNHAAREFVFGRRLSYHFRHHDAISAVFPRGSSEPLDATVSGLHALLARRKVASPFYEVLMDAFLTLLRASVAGRGLVRSGDYAYRKGAHAAGSLLLRHAMSVDDAVVSGDELRFDEARDALEKALAGCSDVAGAPPA
ncbi:hypothetical protein ERJ75_001615300 [Trypanosoma vivax]|nr:hypothetical protein TRVL_09086 [Trypanosoma vivax]KAH8605461.1 hypothetical protein ERJ75_001616600 [Trypanosoma vivax]KAH8605482.1 hypothetical protein ERJ75_001615600 [Trypanosoma vivax]KAH8605508.1 hypothetical protein ERJ75_001616100 [Trypanosoma vivax]KAH8605544.1 hypothetical protein ERJ75_001615300 [Trypanosoma vivax]